MLSYFGTDQSQVQRYLSGKSVRESQLGLLFNGLLKVPMQFFILLVGVMVFVFYQFNSAPLNFNPKAQEAVLNSEYAEEYKGLVAAYRQIEDNKKTLVLDGVQESDKALIKALEVKSVAIKEEAKVIITKADDSVETNDKDYVFIHFILNNLPRGLIGLLLAVILSAAMSSTASELNALASTSVIDLYKRNVKEEKTDEHYVRISKWFTLGWGLIAILFASFAYLVDNLIQLVNIIGSIFYGNVLGIFLLAFFIKLVKGNAVFIAALITQVIIIGVFFMDWLPYLWLNLLGCVLVMGIAIILQTTMKNKPKLVIE
jgi:Na+/proline symporter